MVATYAQRQAAKNYTERQKKKGFNHHTVFCTDTQWMVIKPFVSIIKTLKLENITEVNMDENGVVFVYSDNLGTESETNDEEHGWYSENDSLTVEQKNGGL